MRHKEGRRKDEAKENNSPRQSVKAIRLKCRLCCVGPREPCTLFTAFWPPGILNYKTEGAANSCDPALLIMKWRVHQGGHSEESQALLEDRETLLEEVLLCPPKQRATANTKQCLLKVSPYDEMKSTPGSAFRGEQDFAGRQRSWRGQQQSLPAVNSLVSQNTLGATPPV